ncbi:hypothetical protein JCM10213_007217 [Rhodosporidiobolus nylandii]
MAAVYSKGLPQSVQQLAQGTSHSAHRDYALPSTSSASPAFRSHASSSHPDDFGSFATGSYSNVASAARPSADFVASWSRAPFAGGSTPLAASRGAQEDGAEVGALLGSGDSLHEAADGDWEVELRERQSQAWRREAEELPQADPFASAAARAARDGVKEDAKGKGRAFPLDETPTHKGDMSPTSAELLSSLSSLDLSSRAYLRTLLSLPPELALQDYLANGSYTDDVHGLPDGVKRLFEKAAAQEAGKGEVEEGRRKAVRRLGMVMQHLRVADTAVLDEKVETTLLDEGQAVREGHLASGRFRQDNTSPFLNQDDAVFRSSSPFFQTETMAGRRRSQGEYWQNGDQLETVISAAHQQQFPFSTLDTRASSASETVTSPSSLSPDAYVTFTPSSSPPSASPSLTTARPSAASSEPPAADGQLDKFAAYFEDQQRRTASNLDGRFGPDWTRGSRPGFAGARGGSAAVGTVVEGRTH